MVALDTELGRLGTAITAFDAARSRAVQSAEAIITEASALDTADAACSTGVINAASAARTAARAALAPGQSALAALPGRLAGYRGALSALSDAETSASSLTASQREALTAVVTGGRAEVAALEAFRLAAVTAGPAYQTLNASQSTWLDRRLAGWYRTVQEAAAAYAVFVNDDRATLTAARANLERGDAQRRAASDKEKAAVAGADAALSALRPTA